MGHFGSLWLIMVHFGSFRVLVQPIFIFSFFFAIKMEQYQSNSYLQQKQHSLSYRTLTFIMRNFVFPFNIQNVVSTRKKRYLNPESILFL